MHPMIKQDIRIAGKIDPGGYYRRVLKNRSICRKIACAAAAPYRDSFFKKYLCNGIAVWYIPVSAAVLIDLMKVGFRIPYLFQKIVIRKCTYFLFYF